MIFVEKVFARDVLGQKSSRPGIYGDEKMSAPCFFERAKWRKSGGGEVSNGLNFSNKMLSATLPIRKDER